MAITHCIHSDKLTGQSNIRDDLFDSYEGVYLLTLYRFDLFLTIK